MISNNFNILAKKLEAVNKKRVVSGVTIAPELLPPILIFAF